VVVKFSQNVDTPRKVFTETFCCHRSFYYERKYIQVGDKIWKILSISSTPNQLVILFVFDEDYTC